MALNKFQFFVFFGLFLAASFSCADENKSCPPLAEKPSPEVAQSLIKSARDHGFLWRISKEGHSSYLYGTIHVAKYEWIFPGPKISQALNKSDTVALELDMLDEEVQRKLSKGISEFHHASLSGELVNRMRKQANAVCIPYAAISNLSPEFQVDTLTLMVGTWDKLYAVFSIDGALAGLGHASKKKVISLETPESQLKLLKMKDQQTTTLLVEDSLEELESGRAQVFLSRIAKIWENADYAEMWRFNEWCDCLKTEVERDMMKRMLDDRNPNLADRIDLLHASGKKVFAAVGSLHMFGANGLPTLLEKRGYLVEQIELK
jgi:uncharacterized protein YbaP (TraB family)